MNRTEKAVELIKEAAKLGLYIEFRSGVNIVNIPAPVDPDIEANMLARLVPYLPEVRDICLRRSVVALVKTLVGRRIWSSQSGEGTLLGAAEDGTLTIATGVEVQKANEEVVRRSRSITSGAKDLVILLDEEMLDGASSPHNDKPSSEQPRRGIFERLRGSGKTD